MTKPTNIVPLNESGHTPQVVMHRTLAKAHMMQSVIVIMQWKPEHGGGAAVDWSHIQVRDFAFAHAALTHKLMHQLEDCFDPDADHFPDGAVEEVPTDGEEGPQDAG